jgi:hypothetical protein
MTTNWGTSGIGKFTATLHTEPNEVLDPSKVSLPKPFVVCVVGASRGMLSSGASRKDLAKTHSRYSGIGAGVAFSYAKAGASCIVLASRRISGECSPGIYACQL